MTIPDFRRLPVSGGGGTALERVTAKCGAAPSVEVSNRAQPTISVESTAPASGPSSDAFQPPGIDVPQPRLETHGPMVAQGNALHPDRCTPCAFFCFKSRGCAKGADCQFCHGYHSSKQAIRKLAWKEAQREKRLAVREKKDADFESSSSTFSRQTTLDSRAPTGTSIEARDENKLSCQITEAANCSVGDASRIDTLDTLGTYGNASRMAAMAMENLPERSDPMSSKTSTTSSTAASSLDRTCSRHATEDFSQQPTLDSLPSFSRQVTPWPLQAAFSRQRTEEGSSAGSSASRLGQPRSQDFATRTPTFSRQTTSEVDPLFALAEAERTLAALRAVADSPPSGSPSRAPDESSREERKQLQAQADRCLALINSCFDKLGGGVRPKEAGVREEAAKETGAGRRKGGEKAATSSQWRPPGGKGVEPWDIQSQEPFYIGTTRGCPLYQKQKTSSSCA